MFERQLKAELIACAKVYPVVTVIGPRQSGKTTLVRETFPEKPYVNLEEIDVAALANDDPRAFLAQYPDGAILDEIQQTPDLLSYIQPLVDAQRRTGLFILTGSHQLSLQAHITQSLAGRTAVLHLLPLSLSELQTGGYSLSPDRDIFYGGYPRLYDYNIDPNRYYRDYISTYLERDVKQLINVKDFVMFQRFVTLCAARIGRPLDATALSNELGVARNTVNAWLSVLEASFIIFRLPPYFENFGKRVIKSSKLYFYDLGLVSHLLGMREVIHVMNHPLKGMLFENLVILEILKLHMNRGEDTNLYFYRDNHQAEVDLLYQSGTDIVAIEIKAAQTFQKKFLKSLRKFSEIAKQHASVGYLIYAGEQSLRLRDIQVLNYQSLDRFL